MKHPKDLSIAAFDYPLPDNRIARFPLEDRDASKLLVYRDKQIAETTYQSIADYLPAGAVMVFNDTKVVQARLTFQTVAGHPIEIFCLEPGTNYPDLAVAMAQTGEVIWECLIGGNKKWKSGELHQSFTISGQQITVSAERLQTLNGTFLVRLQWTPDTMSFAEMLDAAGITPLPPYLKRAAENLDKERYQTVYARHNGSVAAPTAGLHFTERVFANMDKKRVTRAFVTLHVGAGTFKPVQSVIVGEHDMHFEFMHVQLPLIRQLAAATAVVAVGTTSLRTIESLYWLGIKIRNTPDLPVEQLLVTQWDPYDLPGSRPPANEVLHGLADYLENKSLQQIVTKTQLMIAPGYTLQVAQALATNFHQPKSTLILLIAAIVGEDWRTIYQYALDHDFRFLSYGDGSLLFAAT